MALKLSHQTFCQLLAQSALIDEERLSGLQDQFAKKHPEAKPESCQEFAEFLIRENELTLWQAKKLLQGKHKGFFLGKYRLLSLLGRGGMSSVYLAEHTVMRRRCAIKVLPFKQVENKASLGRFHREAQAVASLDDPNIVRAYDVDQVKEGSTEIHFLVMEYVEGRSLQQVVDDDGPLGFAEAVEYTRQAASGLKHAHAVGMVHRDVKPSNLLLDETGTVKVLDLGLARILENAAEKSSLTIEYDQTVLGTADYLSPEQAVDSHTVDHRSDIYSLGCTLYFLLVGHPPFPDGTLAQRLLAHQVKEPTPIAELRPDVPQSLVTLINSMMAKQPESRMQSAEAAEQALANWLQTDTEKDSGSAQPNKSSSQQSKSKPQPSRQPTDPTTAGWKDEGTSAKSGKSDPRRSKRPSKSDKSDVGDFRDFLANLDSPSGQETIVPALSVSDTVVSRKKSRLLAGSKRDSFVVGADSEMSIDERPVDSTATHVSAPDAPPTGEIESPRVVTSKSASPRFTTLQIAGASAVSAILFASIGWFLLSSGDEKVSSNQSSEIDSTASVPNGSDPEPMIDPGSDVNVGPQGHFQSITAAIEYVQKHFRPLHPSDVRTIRVAGGQTYPERIVIDNSQFGAFPKGVRIVCEDEQPAVLEPKGNEPIVDLRTVERFLLQGFHLKGTGQPTVLHLEGYLVSTTLQNLTIEGADQFGIYGVGVSGFSGGDRFKLTNVTLRNSGANATAIRFEPGQTPTKDIILSQCRIIGDYETGLAISGSVSNVEMSECIIDGCHTSIRFTDPPEPFKDVSIVNCTFRAFKQGVSVQRQLSAQDGPLTLTKNLFLDGSGPELAVQETPPDPLLTASFNWTSRPAPASNGASPSEVDIFQNNGRRGVNISVTSADSSPLSTYLQPDSAELREAGSAAPPPLSYIGAVPPAGK
ncbi:MAG: serine/threonine-protein kinase [Planctomycetaceae bacterium]